MTNLIWSFVTDTLENAKTAHALGAATMGTGFVSVLNLIPDDIGKVAVVVGIILSTVAIVMNIKKNKRDAAKELRDAAKEEREKAEHVVRMEILRAKRDR
jgi:hypothetical protein